MKKVLIVTMGESTGKSFFTQLNDLLGDQIEFNRSTLDENIDYESYDLYLFSMDNVFDAATKNKKLNKPYLVVRRVVDHKKLLKLIHIREGEDVLLVNDGEVSVTETLERLTEIGLDHVNYTPYFPGCNMIDFREFDIAVTPGESHLVPSGINEVIDIGSRIISIGSIYEIAIKLKLESDVVSNLTGRYVHDIVTVMKEIELNRFKYFESEMYISKAFNSLTLGIVGINGDGVIERLNHQMERIVVKDAKDIKGNFINEMIPQVLPPFEAVDNQTITVHGKQYLCQVNTFLVKEETKYVLSFEFVDDVRTKDIRLKKMNQQQIELHTFSDYKTIDEKNLILIEKAKRFAKSDAQILIEGENGTGKEILAQAIHMASNRRNDCFMPINITAISETLLESELFGYEPGAFTGADKNGKMGIFEKAEGGTVFIDEIGDAPLSIQARLLRVIQEKKIRRVGGHQEFPVDVRIIAATNKNLHKMVQEDLFRQDLFYRLNVLPIQTIPLCKRPDDIKYLLELFLESRIQHSFKILSDIFQAQTLEFLEGYKWPGNVRELLNLCEYVTYSYTGNRMSVEELPYYFKMEKEKVETYHLNYLQYQMLKFIALEGTTGRRSIALYLKSFEASVTEGKVRTMIKTLLEAGFVEVIEKKGVSLTNEGQVILNTYSNKSVWE